MNEIEKNETIINEEQFQSFENLSEDELFEPYKLDWTYSEKITSPAYSYWGSVFRKFFSSKLAIVMLFIMLFVIVMCIFQPMFSGYDNMSVEYINNKEMKFLRPSLEHPFGTDDIGRDMFDAVWAGGRTSLFIAFIATTINTVIGVIVGMFWGFSKKIDTFMIEVYNIIYNIPFTLIVMVLSFTFGAGIWQLILALSCTDWIGTAYFIRVQTMIRRDREYNLASQCLGSSTSKIITHNIFPYLISVLVTSVSRSVPLYISYEVFLGFIGVGLSEEVPSLGRLVQANAQYMQSAAYLFVIPLFVTALISISLYLVGQTLADASDPRNHML